jgi:mannose-6-phosphate isomerase-like protein (cupin superfamily)
MIGTVAPVLAAAEKEEALGASVQTVAQSYDSATPLQQGLIVRLSEKNKQQVEPATYKASKQMFGVTVVATDAPVSLSTDADEQKAYVVTSGRYNVLVSNQNGSIKSGDFVSISAISGIGMKADDKQESVLGRAVGDFDGKTNTLSTATLKQSDGKDLEVGIGSVTVDINIGPNRNIKEANDGVPPVIQSLAKTIVGKPITGTQLYISAAILIVGLGVVASLLYGGIQTGMTAIGRNPLARKSIMRNLIQVIATGIMIFIGCLIAVYLVLKL